jgi:glucose/arabinose dehydrogenase
MFRKLLALVSVLAAPVALAGSLRFNGNGTGDIDRVKIRIDAPAVPADVSGDFTLEWWMRATLADNNTAPCNAGANGRDAYRSGNMIFDRDIFGVAESGEYGVSIRGGRIAFGVNVGGSGESLCSSVSVADNAWHHVAVTRRSTGELAIYVDGAAAGSVAGVAGDVSYQDGRATAFPDQDPYLVIGAEKFDSGPAAPPYRGLLDEVRLSHSIRYDGSYSRQRQPWFADASTVLLLHFDEGFGVAVRDESNAAGGPSDGQLRAGGTTPGPERLAENPPFALAANLAITPLFAGGITNPTMIAHAGDGSGRLFIVEQPGRIRVWNGSSLLATPFLDITSRIGTPGNEQGLLGLAFHPSYETNGRFFVFYTEAGTGSLVIARYTVSGNPNVADFNSEVRLLSGPIPHSQFTNHNGGMLAFGPDGYLYIGTGDGGSGDDPLENGQDIEELLGKILRIDVDPPVGSWGIPATNPFAAVAGADEIWAYGLRNPWRFTFDRLTGDLFIGDVGQDVFEEVDWEPNSSPGGNNYGWDVLEATSCNEDVPAGSCAALVSGGSVLPILWYSLAGPTCAVTGGYVYRGLPNSVFNGQYFYGDYCAGLLNRATGPALPTGTWTTQLIQDTNFLITTFGEDERGNLYFAHRSGSIQRLNPYTFTDVTPSHWAWRWIEAISTAGITSGCTPSTFCPASTTTREQMAVFLLLAKYGQAHLPPPATGTVFADVPASSPFARWIEQLAAEGITAGCGGGNFCPSQEVTRGQMAVFLLVTLEGTGYTPPPATGRFTDVPPSSPFAPWIEELARRGITAGCSPTLFCPNLPIPRDQMAIFLSATFGLRTP